jgi:hypothetical protein
MRLTDPKRGVPLVVALLAGSIALASYVQPNPLSDGLLQVAQLLTATGLLLGVLNVLNVHRRRIAARANDWPYSMVLIVALLATFIIGVLPGVSSDLAALELVTRAVFRYVYQPLAGSVLALLTFFALRAAWRALQLRPREASIILGVAVIFLLVSGPWAAAIPGLDATLDWIRAYPVLGVARGLLLGVGIGALVASMRLLLGLDQPYLDR